MRQRLTCKRCRQATARVSPVGSPQGRACRERTLVPLRAFHLSLKMEFSCSRASASHRLRPGTFLERKHHVRCETFAFETPRFRPHSVLPTSLCWLALNARRSIHETQTRDNSAAPGARLDCGGISSQGA